MEISVDVNIEVDVVTGETAAQVVTSILEILLYQRNQLPFVWDTFKYLISKWNNSENTDPVPDNIQLERQKDTARQTLGCIKQMAEVISKAFRRSNIQRIRFLFGSTATSPREAYTIMIPPISRNHTHEKHIFLISMRNKALLNSLITSNCLYKIFSRNLPPTNLFLELEMADQDVEGWDQVISTDLCELPANCRHILINLVHVKPSEHIEKECCKEMTIFEDFASLSVESEGSEKCDNKTESSTQIGWWQASTTVRGFKQTTVEGRSIWQ